VTAAPEAASVAATPVVVAYADATWLLLLRHWLLFPVCCFCGGRFHGSCTLSKGTDVTDTFFSASVTVMV